MNSKVVNKIKRKYVGEIRNLFPIIRKHERDYFKKMINNIDDSLFDNDFSEIETIKDFYTIYGEPYDIVHQYFSEIETESFYKMIRIRKIVKISMLFICGLCLSFFLFVSCLLFKEHQSYMNSEAVQVSYETKESEVH